LFQRIKSQKLTSAIECK